MVRKKEKIDVEKGQIRQTKSGECRLILMVTDTECLITGEDGEAFKILKSVVDTLEHVL